jgi:hypothetical protein
MVPSRVFVFHFGQFSELDFKMGEPWVKHGKKPSGLVMAKDLTVPYSGARLTATLPKAGHRASGSGALHDEARRDL